MSALFFLCLGWQMVNALEVGETIKDFELKTFDGKESIKLSELVKSKKVLLNFWASWCTACKKEIGELEELKKKYPEVVYIAVNAGEKHKKAKRFVKKTGFTYKILEDKNKAYSKSIGVLSLPQSIVVGPDRKVIYKSDVPPKSL